MSPFITEKLFPSITKIGLNYFCLAVYYILTVYFLAPFLVVEFGATANALRYTIIASFALIFLDRFFQEQKIKLNNNEKFGIREILLTIVFLGFLKTLMAGIPQLTTPEYEKMNLTFLIPLLDLFVITIWKLPKKIVPKINQIIENK